MVQGGNNCRGFTGKRKGILEKGLKQENPRGEKNRSQVQDGNSDYRGRNVRGEGSWCSDLDGCTPLRRQPGHDVFGAKRKGYRKGVHRFAC